MNAEFARKKLLLAQIIDDRRVGFCENDKVPKKFSFVKAGGSVKCYQTSELAPPEFQEKLFDVYIPVKGFKAREWDDMTDTLLEYL